MYLYSDWLKSRVKLKAERRTIIEISLQWRHLMVSQYMIF